MTVSIRWAPPTLVAAVAVSETELEAQFYPPADPARIGNVVLYSVSPALALVRIRSATSTEVRQETQSQRNGVLYTLSYTDPVEVIAGQLSHFAGIGSPPTLVSATAVDSNHVDLVFSEQINLATIQVGAFQISPALAIVAAQVMADGTTVRLTTAEQVAGMAYVITVSGIKDLAGNPVSSATSAVFSGVAGV